MRRTPATTVLAMMVMALWMTMGSAYAADTCTGYGNKENVPSSGSGSFNVVHNSTTIGTISWNNDVEPEIVTWSVADGYSLSVCVKGGSLGLTTGSGQSGSLAPQLNSGGQTPDVSHFGWTVNVITPTVTRTTPPPSDPPPNPPGPDKGDKKTEVDPKTVVKDEVIEPDEDDPQVAIRDSTVTPQVSRVPVGPAATGGGSTSGVENASLFVVGGILLAAAVPVLIIRRRLRGTT